jgi:hypothetical protein
LRNPRFGQPLFLVNAPDEQALEGRGSPHHCPCWRRRHFEDPLDQLRCVEGLGCEASVASFELRQVEEVRHQRAGPLALATEGVEALVARAVA